MEEKTEKVMLYLMTENVSKEKIMKQTGARLADIHSVAEKHDMKDYKLKLRSLVELEKLPDYNPVPKGIKTEEVMKRRQVLADLWLAGLTYNEIMAATGVGKNTITNALKQRGVFIRDRQDCIRNWQEIALSMAGKMTLSKLCVILHVSHQKLRAFYREKGINYLMQEEG